MSRSLLVYDGRRPLFRAAAAAFTRGIEGVVPVRWESEPVQAFLAAQFGARPFVFALIDEHEVHVGSETVAQVLERRGYDGRLPGLLKRAYPATAPVGRLVHGREPAAIDGTFPLTEDARAAVAPLRRRVEIPVERA